jgi:hypothetical protein
MVNEPMEHSSMGLGALALEAAGALPNARVDRPRSRRMTGEDEGMGMNRRLEGS